MTTLPTRAERVAALRVLAPLAGWEPPREELLVATVLAEFAGRDLRQEVWYRAVDLAWSACRWRFLTANPAEARALRIWCLVTADRVADEWTESVNA